MCAFEFQNRTEGVSEDIISKEKLKEKTKQHKNARVADFSQFTHPPPAHTSGKPLGGFAPGTHPPIGDVSRVDEIDEEQCFVTMLTQ